MRLPSADDSITMRGLFAIRALDLAKPWPYSAGFHPTLIRNLMILFDLSTCQRILYQARETPAMIADGYTPVAAGRLTFDPRSRDV